METEILNIEGQNAGKCELPQMLFGQKPDKHFLHEVITIYMGNQRSGTASTKGKGDVSGGGRKPWKQKHTGRARHGSTRSPIWRHGGIAFGPRPHSFRRGLPIAKRRLALAQSLSGKFSQGAVIVVDGLAISEPKTKQLAGILRSINGGKKPLLVWDKGDSKIKTAGKNIPGLEICLVADLNAYRVLKSSKVIITKEAVASFNAMCGKGL
ncbi:MAG: 50S ribosomal protein L4 [Elusimicrobia bacterium]|nr:50S ribosomal protein L4 [Elusimicrobiota bacterium]